METLNLINLAEDQMHKAKLAYTKALQDNLYNCLIICFAKPDGDNEKFETRRFIVKDILPDQGTDAGLFNTYIRVTDEKGNNYTIHPWHNIDINN